LIIDEILKKDLYLSRLKGDASTETIKKLEIAETKIIKVINKSTKLTDKQRYRLISSELREIIKEAYSGFTDLMLKDMEDITELTFNSTIVALTAATAINPKVKWVDVSQSVKNKLIDKNRPILGSTLKDIQLDKTVRDISRFRQTIADSFERNASLPMTERAVIASNAVTELNGKIRRNEIKTLTRTILKSAIEEARGESYKYFDDVIVGYTSLATLDMRTSKLCASLDNVFYPKSKYRYETIPNKPPRHFNCRTLLVAETKESLKREDTRTYALHDAKIVNHRDGTHSTKFTVAKGGLVSDKLSFNDWFKRQPAEYQKSYLGKTRYELFKKDPKVLEEMYSITKNKMLTLSELKKKLAP